MRAVMRNKVCSLLGLIAGVYHHLEIPWIRPSWSPFWGTFISISSSIANHSVDFALLSS